MKIAYEPHPVSPERKAELRAAGFKIIDAVFKPVSGRDVDVVGADAQTPTVRAVEPVAARRGRLRKAKD